MKTEYFWVVDKTDDDVRGLLPFSDIYRQTTYELGDCRSPIKYKRYKIT